MSRLERRRFSATTGMPDDFKIMGTVSNDISKKINNMAITGDQTDTQQILEHLVHQHIKTPLGKVKVDKYEEPFEGKFNVNTNYSTENLMGGFFIVTKGSMWLEVGKRKIELKENKIYFVNERNAWRIYKTNNTVSVAMSAIFAWDKKVHGET